MKTSFNVLFLMAIFAAFGCSGDDEANPPPDVCSNNTFHAETSRNFKMGFSSWPYAATQASVTDTYQFLEQHSDIYSEHIDNRIPWNAWINNLPLPTEFTNDIDGRVSRKIESIDLTLSVSLLNSDRSDLAEDFDGGTPEYTALNDATIEDAYVAHISYLNDRFEPDYLIIAIEVNELRMKSPEKWSGYKLLMTNVKSRIQTEYPGLRISESMTLHNLYEPDVPEPEEYLAEMVSYVNELDFAAISFYPFFKGLNSTTDFQEAFDFLHAEISRPIAFSETSHLSEDLSVDSFELFIESDECEQNLYLETLFSNAFEQEYEYVIWWAHRDFYELWLTFPEDVQDLGKLWRNTGLVADDGSNKKAFSTWELVLDK